MDARPNPSECTVELGGGYESPGDQRIILPNLQMRKLRLGPFPRSQVWEKTELGSEPRMLLGGPVAPRSFAQRWSQEHPLLPLPLSLPTPRSPATAKLTASGSPG